jgi:hypothetical protein
MEAALPDFGPNWGYGGGDPAQTGMGGPGPARNSHVSVYCATLDLLAGDRPLSALSTGPTPATDLVQSHVEPHRSDDQSLARSRGRHGAKR